VNTKSFGFLYEKNVSPKNAVFESFVLITKFYAYDQRYPVSALPKEHHQTSMVNFHGKRQARKLQILLTFVVVWL